jgi:hypothetical protein
VGAIEVEITMQTKNVMDNQHLCGALDFFGFKGMEVALQGWFVGRIISIQDF